MLSVCVVVTNSTVLSPRYDVRTYTRTLHPALLNICDNVVLRTPFHYVLILLLLLGVNAPAAEADAAVESSLNDATNDEL
jgi:hypothetical protein